ncbi:MAG: hypothetical protein OMM_14012 [Candidatus Magnetoglobus multicellularis str. Araruama]|uniref:TIR domain-containing protein n=1 Tax=Candidatus Magnetoglobus multicellularis str. Araruama TaxID=890399 RepID=A0A1V1NSN4_9BACT|nr:MAG: hypothetical protein OMM_14012 [Candidatus Magnetoglobus multicellularis str. Araruama]
MREIGMNNTCKPNFDIFISYRSENIHTVRPIAEHLMGCGIKVWFAEYKVLLKGRERFNKAIREGATNCSYGLCFTNDSYAQSEHCKKKCKCFWIALGHKIINICHPKQPLTLNKFPDLQKGNTFNYSDSIQVLKIIQSITGFDTGLSLDKNPIDRSKDIFFNKWY